MSSAAPARHLPAAEGVPLELRARPQWVCWRYEEREGKRTKVPYRPDGTGRAAADDPSTWGTFEAASATASATGGRGFDGVGYVVTGDYVGIDLDHVIRGGELLPWAARVVARLASYTERTPSGDGVRVWCRGPWPSSRHKRVMPEGSAVEVYTTKRYFTVTGNAWPAAPAAIEHRADELADLAAELWPERTAPPPVSSQAALLPEDDELFRLAEAARNGPKFSRLWRGDTSDHGGDESAADLALCTMLAFWTGRDHERVDRLFRRSGLMRQKWDLRRGETTYGARTIAKACSRCTEVYQPRAASARVRPGPWGPRPSGPAPDPDAWEDGRDERDPGRTGGEPERPAGLPFVRVADVASERVTWAWSRRVPFGKLTVIDGDPGLGKSTLLADLTARWTRGDSLPGETAGREPAGVVLILAEDGISDTIRPRLEVAGADLTRVVAIKGLPIFPAQLADLHATVTETRSRVIVLDPGLAFLDPELDAHNDAQARRYAAGLADLAERSGAAAIFVRHLNKAGGGTALYRGGGSIAFIATARSGLLVAPDPHEPARRILAATKSNLCAAPATLLYRVVADGPEEPGRVQWEGESTVSAGEALAAANDRRAADSAAKRSGLVAVLRELLAAGPVPAEEVERAVRDAGVSGDDPLSQRTVRAARRVLGIRSVKTGWKEWSWALPERAGMSAEGPR